MVIRLFYFLKTGVIHGGDTEFYLGFANLIKENQTVFGITDHPFYYSLYPLFLLLFQFNEQAIVIFQIILSAFSTVVLYLIGNHVFFKSVGIIAATIHILSWEIFQWDVYVLTDSLAVSLITITTFLLLQSTQARKAQFMLPIIFLTLLLFFLRPATFPFIIMAYAFLILNLKSRKIQYLLTGSIVSIFGLLLVFFGIQSGSYSLPFFLQTYITEFADAAVIHHRVYLSLNNSGSILAAFTNIIQIVLARFAMFWQPFAHTFSFAHSIVNTLYLIPLYLCSLYYLIRQNGHMLKKEIIFILSVIIVYWLFHSVTLIDYDWRYRVTVLPFLIIIASAGIDLCRKKSCHQSAMTHL